MITPTGVQKDLQRILNTLDHAVYTIDETAKVIPFHSTKIENGVLRIHLYLDDTITGNVTNFKIIDKDGDIYIDRADNINKTGLKGTYISFSYKYEVKEVLNALQ